VLDKVIAKNLRFEFLTDSQSLPPSIDDCTVICAVECVTVVVESHV
jgi:hypothetical protein